MGRSLWSESAHSLLGVQHSYVGSRASRGDAEMEEGCRSALQLAIVQPAFPLRHESAYTAPAQTAARKRNAHWHSPIIAQRIKILSNHVPACA